MPEWPLAIDWSEWIDPSRSWETADSFEHLARERANQPKETQPFLTCADDDGEAEEGEVAA